MASFKSVSVIPDTDCDAFKAEVERFNSHGEYHEGAYCIFIYEGRDSVESASYGDPKNPEFIANGIETGTHLHVSVTSWGDLLIRGNIDLGRIIDLEVEESRGFSVPVSALDILKSNHEVLSIINEILASCGASQGITLAEYIDDFQAVFCMQADGYSGIFSACSDVKTDDDSESYSMVIYTSKPGSSVIQDRLIQLAESLENLGIEFFVAPSVSTYGDYDDGNPIIGPGARIDASFGEVELYIVDDEICIEGS